MSDNTPTRDITKGYPSVEGLVTKVRTSAGTYQPSWVMPVCSLCGALLVDALLHDEFHERIGDERQHPDPST